MIGGGIIGLSVGWQLARHKIPVTILERRQAGSQASWAAAGMLCPYLDSEYENRELLRISEQSLSQYPRFLQELSEDSQCQFSAESQGTLYVAMDRDDSERLRQCFSYKTKAGMPLQWVSGEEARKMEPLLSPQVMGGIWAPDEKQVNNRLVLEALKAAFLARGGKLIERSAVKSVYNDGNGLRVTKDDGQQLKAGIVVNASGAWADQFEALPGSNGRFIRPVKGQIISLAMAPHLRLKHMVRTPRIYLAPKQDGILRIGATSEDMGFDERATGGAIMDLLRYAWEAFPAIYEYPFVEVATGLRPVSSDANPFIGASSLKGLYHAIGHGRSGILLTPYTAYTLKEIILRDLSHENSI